MHDTGLDAHKQATTTANPHYGVALELADGTLFTTRKAEGERHTVQVLDKAGSKESPIVLGDYKVDEDAEIGRAHV